MSEWRCRRPPDLYEYDLEADQGDSNEVHTAKALLRLFRDVSTVYNEADAQCAIAVLDMRAD